MTEKLNLMVRVKNENNPGKNKTTPGKCNIWLFPFENLFSTVSLQMKIGDSSLLIDWLFLFSFVL